MPEEPLSVKNALEAMQHAVCKGEIQMAKDIGGRACVPLSINACDLSISDKISEGAESVVFRGRFRDHEVAVKKLRLSHASDLDRFRRELNMLATFQHPNVISLLGAKALPPDYMMVLPLQQTNLRELIYERGWRPGWDELLRLALQLADAMSYVHSHDVVHRDIKPANILMGSDGNIRVSDFGIAVTAWELSAPAHQESSLRSHGKPSGGFHKKRMVGTLEYMAPEVLLKHPQTCASDVYAFAITLNELATRVFPFSDCTKDNPEVHTVLELGYGRQELAAAVAAEGLRPLLPCDAPPGFRDLISACWAHEPSQRPTFRAVHQTLQAVVSGLPAWRQEQLAKQAASSIMVHATAILEPITRVEVDTRPQASDGEASWLNAAGETSSGYTPIVSAGVFEAIGPRDTMEDRHIILTRENSFLGAQAASLFAVFDGHRGSEAAEFCKCHLRRILERCTDAPSPSASLTRAFKQMDEGYWVIWNKQRQERFAKGMTDGRYPGCTALAALLVGRTLYVANAGDCRAVLCRGHAALALSNDHTASSSSERERVVAAGGQVSFQHNSWRIGSSGLQVTRCIGDFDEKQHGVTSEPEVQQVVLSEADHFLILGSDGLWDVMQDEQAVGLVLDTVKQPDMCAKRLVMEALTRGSNDNVTAIVAFLTPVSTLERVFADGQQSHHITATVHGSRKAPTTKYAAASLDEVRDTY